MMRLAFVTFFIISTTTYAAADPAQCAGIKQDKKRLECFDSTVKVSRVVAKNGNTIYADEALKALRKIAGATEIGVSMRDYSQLVLDAASTCDEALRKLPDSDFKSAALESRQAFIDARTLWGSMFDSQYVSVFLKYNDSLISKYQIDSNVLEKLRSLEFAKTIDMPKGIFLSPVWKAAKEHLGEAEKLAAEGKI